MESFETPALDISEETALAIGRLTLRNLALEKTVRAQNELLEAASQKLQGESPALEVVGDGGLRVYGDGGMVEGEAG